MLFLSLQNLYYEDPLNFVYITTETEITTNNR